MILMYIYQIGKFPLSTLVYIQVLLHVTLPWANYGNKACEWSKNVDRVLNNVDQIDLSFALIQYGIKSRYKHMNMM